MNNLEKISMNKAVNLVVYNGATATLYGKPPTPVFVLNYKDAIYLKRENYCYRVHRKELFTELKKVMRKK